MTSTTDNVQGVPQPTDQQLKSQDAEQAPRSQRMEGWVRYCEYFHMLDADMQHTMDVTRWRFGVADGQSQSGGRVRAREHDSCFDSIVHVIKQHDKPLVREGGKDGKLVLGEGTAAGNGELHMLGDADLAMVRARLRAAAASSNLRTIAPSELTTDFAEELDFNLQPKSKAQRKRGIPGSSDPSTCAAAIETLLWFGLALGETPRAREARNGKLGGRGKRPFARGLGMQKRSSPMGMAHDLKDTMITSASCEQLELDWEQAVHAAGLSDENEAMEALQAVRALEAAEAEQNSKQVAAVREREEHGCAAFEVAERMKSKGKSSGEGFDSLSEAGSDDSAKSENGSTSTMSTCDLSGDENTEQALPDESSPARRSRRFLKPSRQWAAESPLIKWEKEQHKHKRRKRGASRQQEGCDDPAPYETDSSLDGHINDLDRNACADLSIDIAMFD